MHWFGFLVLIVVPMVFTFELMERHQPTVDIMVCTMHTNINERAQCCANIWKSVSNLSALIFQQIGQIIFQLWTHKYLHVVLHV